MITQLLKKKIELTRHFCEFKSGDLKKTRWRVYISLHHNLFQNRYRVTIRIDRVMQFVKNEKKNTSFKTTAVIKPVSFEKSALKNPSRARRYRVLQYTYNNTHHITRAVTIINIILYAVNYYARIKNVTRSRWIN